VTSGDPISSRLEHFDAPDPMGRDPDPWADFRSVEVLGLEWVHRYRHSLGKYSRFFLALEQGRLVATKCPQCESVWLPPRPVCPNDLSTTQWIELPGTGTLAGFSVIHRSPAAVPALPAPYVLAYADLDGADTLFLHVLDVEGDLSRVTYGMALRVAFNAGPVDHPIWLMSFVPATALSEDSSQAGNYQVEDH
jgi:hypothetical protein